MSQSVLHPAQFYHGTDAELRPGQEIIPPAERNPDNPEAAQANPVTGGEDPHNTFMTEYAKDARNWAGPFGHVYQVEPLGQQQPDPNGGKGDWAVQGHLRVLGTQWDGPKRGTTPCGFCQKNGINLKSCQSMHAPWTRGL